MIEDHLAADDDYTPFLGAIGDEHEFDRSSDEDAIHAAGLVLALTQAGHGFGILTLTQNPAKIVQTRCRHCQLPMVTTMTEWLCEFDGWDGCCCNWCLCRQQYEAGIYRGAGRPRVQCGLPACKRQHAAERKRRSRTAK